uniref:Proteasome alpha-type subunits domain-containing protein n=1 Tax=Branchiostoma floridae TaxID=7739 RepID=C3ZPW4_BRAFL|eukprot:XP_002589332.1 hypothetical protein BRAFLDRAFT_77784 [Branchiostoma floridae]
MFRNQYDNDVTVWSPQRAPSELSDHQRKVIPIDDHIGVSIAGLTADARLLSKFMRTECLNSRYAYESPLPVSRLVSTLGNSILYLVLVEKLWKTFLVIEMGPHIYQTCPSSNYFDCKCMAIGARSQSARTYLERHINEFLDCAVDDLVRHGLRALRETLPNEQELNTKLAGIEHEKRERGAPAAAMDVAEGQEGPAADAPQDPQPGGPDAMEH